LVLSTGVVVAGGWFAHRARPSIVEIDAFRLINDLPAAFAAPLIGVMQLGALAAVPVFSIVALLARRPRLARLLLLGGTTAWVLSKVLQTIVDEEPPALVIGRVALHGAVSEGLAFPATHVAVVAALATVAAPYLARPNRRLVWSLVIVVAIARIYVGVHLPVDVIGGAGVGWGVGSFLHLLFGAPRGFLDAPAVRRALEAAGVGVQSVDPVAPVERGWVLFEVKTTDTSVAAKALTRDQPEADWLYVAWRALAFREMDDERVIGSPAHRVDHEAYVLLLAERAGIRVPSVITTVTVGEGDALLVRAWIDGKQLSRLGGDEIAEETLVQIWQQLAGLHELGITHGAPRPDHWVVDQRGCPWLVEVGNARVSEQPRAQLRDIAELCVSLAQTVGVGRAVESAAQEMGEERLGAALSFLQPLALSPATRRGLRTEPGLLADLRVAVASATGNVAAPVESPARIATRNLLPVLGALVAVNVLLLQVGQAHATFDALRRAQWGWLIAVAVIAALNYLMAAIALIGAAGQRLALGRTWAVQLAVAFTNRLAPAGIAGMATNVRYLEATGTPRSAAIAAVTLDAAAGFVVHVVGIAAIVPLLRSGGARLHFSGPDLPDRWPFLLAAIATLVGAGVLRWGRTVRRHLAPHVRTAAGALANTMRQPSSAAALFLGSAGVTTGYALALAATCQAFGLRLGVTTIVAVYLAGAAIGSVAPVPGGLGALEAALAAGLVAAGAPTGPAIAAVLTYRLITYWLPALPGLVSYQFLRRSGTL
jgi:undecaprenyl-diphosphatase